MRVDLSVLLKGIISPAMLTTWRLYRSVTDIGVSLIDDDGPTSLCLAARG